MKISQLMESMDFSPIAKKHHPKFGEIWSSVIPDEKTSYIDYDEMKRQGKTWMDYDDLDGPPKNPNYDPNYELNLSNVMMTKIMNDVLGFSGDSSDGFHIPIDEFLARATAWLRQNLDKPSEEIPTEFHKREVGFAFDADLGVDRIQPKGPRMISGGRPEGYVNDVIMKMVKLAREGKKLGATHVSAI